MTGDRLALGSVAVLAALAAARRRGSRGITPKQAEKILELVMTGDPDNIQVARELSQALGEPGLYLPGADLHGANLDEANLKRANLQGADLRSILYDAATTWPTDFSPPPSRT